MKYDFTTILDRAGHDSLAADAVPFDVQPDPDVRKIPMWVADMSFPAAPPIIEAIEKRLEMPNFGYFSLPDSYFDSIISWQQRRNGVWRMDYADMDAKLKRHHIHLAILCSPHNPCGRVWERWELERAMEVYAANDCLVISDEIWSDIIMPGHKHIPTQSVSADARERTMAFYAPSKTFSLAGLIGSYHIIYNTYLRDRVVRQSEVSHYNDCNVLSLHALLGAYSPAGEEWADEMCRVIDANHEYACNFIRDNFKGVRVMRPEGTYMLYLDCADWCRKHGVTIRELQERGIRAGVIWQDGEAFMRKDTIRMNLALPHSLLEEAMQRLKEKAFV